MIVLELTEHEAALVMTACAGFAAFVRDQENRAELMELSERIADILEVE